MGIHNQAGLSQHRKRKMSWIACSFQKFFMTCVHPSFLRLEEQCLPGTSRFSGEGTQTQDKCSFVMNLKDCPLIRQNNKMSDASWAFWTADCNLMVNNKNVWCFSSTLECSNMWMNVIFINTLGKEKSLSDICAVPRQKQHTWLRQIELSLKTVGAAVTARAECGLMWQISENRTENP